LSGALFLDWERLGKKAGTEGGKAAIRKYNNKV